MHFSLLWLKKGERMYTRASGGLPKFGRNQHRTRRQNSADSYQLGYIKREPVNDALIVLKQTRDNS